MMQQFAMMSMVHIHICLCVMCTLQNGELFFERDKLPGGQMAIQRNHLIATGSIELTVPTGPVELTVPTGPVELA